MSALGDTLAALAVVLDGRGLNWYVFGAQAVAIRGAPRTTQDIDVTVGVPIDEVQALVSDLEGAGVRLRYPDLFEDLLRRGSVMPMAHSSGMEVDLVVAGSGLEQLAMGRATRVMVEGTSVPVAHATDLVVMKVLAGRGKDLDDVRALLATGDVDVQEARGLLRQFEDALGQSGLLDALDEALVDADAG